MLRSTVFRATIVLTLVLVLHATAVQAQPERFIVVTEIWPPFRIAGTETDANRFTGIDMDLIKVLAERLGVTFDVRRQPWARCLESMRTGEADLITGLAYTEERAAFIHYSAVAYYSVSPAFFTARGQGPGIRRYEDLYAHRVGYSINSAYFEPFNSDTRLNKVGVATEGQLLQMLAHGRLDVIIGTDANLAFDIARMGLGDRVEPTAYRPRQETPLFVGISKQSKLMARAEELDAILDALVASGTVQRMAAKHF